MADNVPITPGAGVNIAADEVLGVKYPRSKMTLGRDGVNAGDIHDYNPVPMHLLQSESAFGDLKTVSPIEQVSANFTYEVNPEEFYKFTFGTGAITNSNSRAVLSTGGTANSIAAVVSRRTTNYRPGLGSTARFTAGFDTSVTADASTSAGLGTEENALMFVYKNSTMNILHRRGGQRDARLLDITTGSSSPGTVALTLDDNLINISVTDNGGNTAETATEIVTELNTTHAVALLIAGYQAFAYGNHVTLIALRTGLKSGTFSVGYGATGIVGPLSQLAVGETATETLIPQSSWNKDKADGTDYLPNIDWSLGNVFQIKYQWLGFGLMSFAMEDPNTSQFVKLHDIHYAGSSAIPNIENANLPLIWVAGNGATTDDISMYGSSGAAYLEGGTSYSNFQNKKSAFNSDTIGTTETPLICFCMPDFYQGKTNESIADFFRLALSSSGAGQFAIYKGTDANPLYLEGNTSWQSVTPNTMVVYDTASTGWSGGLLQSVFRADGTVNLSATAEEIDLFNILPGEMILVTAQADSGSIKFAGTFTWAENK